MATNGFYRVLDAERGKTGSITAFCIQNALQIADSGSAVSMPAPCESVFVGGAPPRRFEAFINRVGGT